MNKFTRDTGINDDGGKYIYEGQVTRKGLWDGLGYISWPEDSEFYFGDWEQGRRTGFGMHSDHDGSTFFGQHVDGKRCGLGAHSLSNGDFYMGYFDDGPVDFGVLFTHSGDIIFSQRDSESNFIGKAVKYNFRTHKFSYRKYGKNGNAKKTVEVPGEFELDSVPHFLPIIMKPASEKAFSVSNGVNNKGENWEYHGQIRGSSSQGLGLMFWDNTDSYYFGEWEEAKNGVGLYRFPSGAKYCGHVKQNDFTETSFYFYNNGTIRLANSDENERDTGFTIRFNNRKELIIATSSNDSFEGTGIIISPDMTISIVLYDDGSVKTVYKTFVADDDLKISEYDGDGVITMKKPTITHKADEEDDVDDLDIESIFNDMEEEEASDAEAPVKEGKDPEEELDKLIGLEPIKRTVRGLVSYFKKVASDGEKINMNMMFLGNPGTGKTVVARLISGILYKNKVIKENNCIEVSRSNLVGQYQGETARNVRESIEKAKGGVLFIDEAYSLINSPNDSYGKEAVAELTKRIEDANGEMVVIMAGYGAQMDTFVNQNPGLASRFAYKLTFPDYSRQELGLITKLMLSSTKFTASDEVVDAIVSIVFSRRGKENFANAREIRAVFDKVKLIQAIRTQDNLSDFEINIDDIKQFMDTEGIKPDLSVFEKLNQLVGLQKIKETIVELRDYHANNKDTDMDLHMAFVGNPGTGKTEVARLIADLYYQAGVLPTNNFIEATKSDLVAEYSGQTTPKVDALVNKAIGGVLFIDEAYSLVDEKGYGAEAIAELIKLMEDKRGQFCCILAGYRREMQELFSSNSGFVSRISEIIVFQDYDKEELKQIAQLIVSKQKYEIDEDALNLLIDCIMELKKRPGFANGREVRNAVSFLMKKQSHRVGVSKDRVIKVEDVELYKKNKGISFENENDGLKLPADFIEKINKEFAKIPSSSFSSRREDIEEAVFALSNDGEDGSSEGTGFFISEDGYGITCEHCVADAKSLRVRVRFKDRRGNSVDNFHDAKVIMADKAHDCALIKVINPDKKFSIIPLIAEDEKPLEPLSEVIMLGYPFGFSRFDVLSLNEGKVNSYQRSEGVEVINLDIEAHSGNSGSGVLDKATGKVVGILRGAALHRSSGYVQEINYCVRTSHIWDLIKTKVNIDNNK